MFSASKSKGASSGYQIANSLRFRSSASAYLNRTPSVAGNRKTWTISFWMKRGAISAYVAPFGVGISGGSNFYIRIEADNTIYINEVSAGITNISLITSQVFRDPSAWYHVVLAVDTTQATASNRVKFYINGTQVTAFSSATYPSQNYDTFVNSTNVTWLGAGSNNTTPNYYFDGYMADINFIDGQALTPSSFGAFDSITGVWKPQAYAGTYGTNGFHLNFSNGTSTTTLGYDSSGNSNNWTTNNISLTAGSTYDWMIDSPTSFAGSSYGVGNYCTLNPLVPGASALSNGNLTSAGSTVYPTIQPTSGNWYFEINGAAKNWTPPAAFPTGTGDFNFGQRPFANTPTTGYISLCTYNLPTPSILNGAAYLAATTYTGTGSSLSVSNAINSVSFQPDLVWIKSRSAATDHALYDVIRGTQNRLESNTTDAAVAADNGLTAFNSNGFTVNTLAQVNTNAATYIGWQWKAGGTAVTNTAGSITSQVSANTTSGFSVVALSNVPTSGNSTFGHGLGVAPNMVIIKYRNLTSGWYTYHSAIGAGNYLFLQGTNASASSANIWNNTNPTSSVFTLGSDWASASPTPLVAYCFAAIAGYSAFGSYTGNGSTDGPFVYLGFRPRWVLLKRTNTSGTNWVLVDTARDTYNLAGQSLEPNLSNAEYAPASAGYPMDILSNGFKLRSSDVGENNSGDTYIYAAFAENPFQNSLAR